MVYVDDMKMEYRGMIMCHMVADSLDELHAMADKIGIHRKWFQNKNPARPHYDISLGKRSLAVKLGAKEITQKQTIEILRRHYE